MMEYITGGVETLKFQGGQEESQDQLQGDIPAEVPKKQTTLTTEKILYME